MLQDYWLTAGRHLKISLILVVLAIILGIFFPGLPRWFKAGAMLISWLADMILGRYEPFNRLIGGYSFLKGAALFMLAHLLYLAAFALLLGFRGQLVINAGFWLGCAILAGFMLLMVILYVRNPDRQPVQLLIGMVYGLIIGILGVAVCTYAVRQKGLAWLSLIGIISFMISDLLIGLDTIGGIKLARQDDLIWIFYPLGQLLLIL